MTGPFTRIATPVPTATDRLEASEARYRALVARIPDVVWTASIDGEATFVSPNVEGVCGFSADAMLEAGKRFWLDRVHPDDLGRVRAAYHALVIAMRPLDIEYRWRRRDGLWVWLHDRASVARREGVDCIEGLLADVTARRSLEDQMRQAQKSGAVGRLSGEVAHDFNNILATVLANCHLLMENLGDRDPRRADVEGIKAGAERAATLTRQLVAFSRCQELAPKALDLNGVVGGLERLLRRLLGAKIEFSVRLAAGAATVLADAGQIEQVLLNLANNAREAMPRGGTLEIETMVVRPDDGSVTNDVPTVPGSYVTIAVSDTGTGMDAETRRRAFEPSFTTKSGASSAGLGLAACYGIVKRFGGHIWIDGTPGGGTTVKIHLPLLEDPAEVGVAHLSGATDALRGTETVLMVEDDRSVREIVGKILTSRGYRVLTARDGDEAVAAARTHTGPLDLLLSDVIVPACSGAELVSRVRASSPRAKSLFMSGYLEHEVLHDGSFDPGMNFIQKPFSPDALLQKVREVLDE